jgi:hypothetical protein
LKCCLVIYSPTEKNTGLIHIQIFLLEECGAINGDRVTYACGIWHESHKYMGCLEILVCRKITSINLALLRTFEGLFYKSGDGVIRLK